MIGEFNDLTTSNIKTTFDVKTNNIATSDEKEAPAVYEVTKVTAYAKGKAAARIVAASGIVLIAASASIATGSLISNSFILNPPTVSNTTFEVKDDTFYFSFTIKNKNKYSVSYYIFIDGVLKMEGDCSEATSYNGEFSDFKEGDSGLFYIQFANNVDYKKTILETKFNTGGIIHD